MYRHLYSPKREVRFKKAPDSNWQRMGEIALDIVVDTGPELELPDEE